MTPRKRAACLPLPSDWHESAEVKINGRTVTPGTELTVAGVRGRVRFVRYVQRDSGVEWVDVIAPGGAGFRSFRPERVRRVHVRRKLRAAETVQ